MTLTLYFFRQFLSPFLFGTILFLFVLLLDRIFDLIDLIFNKGVQIFVVVQLLFLFMPTLIPLTLPMAFLLACLVTFGRMSEENELTATRACGISLAKVLWLPVTFALGLSVLMIPFNTILAPQSNSAFRTIYEKIIHADPLVNVEPRKFFSIRDFRIFAEKTDSKSHSLQNVFVYQMSAEGRPTDRIFARRAIVQSDQKIFRMSLYDGQLQRYSLEDPQRLLHITFGSYDLEIPLDLGEKLTSTRFRNIPSRELRKMIASLKKKGLPTSQIEAERHLRLAIAFAPIALTLMGIPLATALKKGSRSFGFGITILLIFAYYLLLIGGLTLAEKNILPPALSLWIANLSCMFGSIWLIRRMLRQ